MQIFSDTDIIEQTHHKSIKHGRIYQRIEIQICKEKKRRQQHNVKEQGQGRIPQRNIHLAYSLQNPVGHSGEAVENHTDTSCPKKGHSQVYGSSLGEQDLHDWISQNTQSDGTGDTDQHGKLDHLMDLTIASVIVS